MQNARERHLTSKEIVALTFSEPRKILSYKLFFVIRNLIGS